MTMTLLQITPLRLELIFRNLSNDRESDASVARRSRRVLGNDKDAIRQGDAWRLAHQQTQAACVIAFGEIDDDFHGQSSRQKTLEKRGHRTAYVA